MRLIPNITLCQDSADRIGKDSFIVSFDTWLLIDPPTPAPQSSGSGAVVIVLSVYYLLLKYNFMFISTNIKPFALFTYILTIYSESFGVIGRYMIM